MLCSSECPLRHFERPKAVKPLSATTRRKSNVRFCRATVDSGQVVSRPFAPCRVGYQAFDFDHE
jgi:hypothetical protein